MARDGRAARGSSPSTRRSRGIELAGEGAAGVRRRRCSCAGRGRRLPRAERGRRAPARQPPQRRRGGRRRLGARSRCWSRWASGCTTSARAWRSARRTPSGALALGRVPGRRLRAAQHDRGAGDRRAARRATRPRSGGWPAWGCSPARPRSSAPGSARRPSTGGRGVPLRRRRRGDRAGGRADSRPACATEPAACCTRGRSAGIAAGAAVLYATACS